MSNKHGEQDVILKWGHEAAIGVFVLAMIAAILLIVSAAVNDGDVGAATIRGLGILALGGGAAFGVLRLRKSRERAARPAWMGSTTAWRDGIKAKIAPDDDTAAGGS